jgi:PqqD family protein of HPr-rel-A system
MQQVTLAANRNAAFAVLDDGAVLLNAETGRYFGLDEVATHIWSRLVEGANEPQLVDSLVATYDVEPGRARADVTAFLERLNRLGLLQVDDGCAAGR